MGETTRQKQEIALEVLQEMIGRSQKAQLKFAIGTSQHTLQENRINALQLACGLLLKELDGTSGIDCSEEEVKKALAPLKSLISKSEKAQLKLETKSWQYRMLDDNLRALKLVLPLVEHELEKLTAY